MTREVRMLGRGTLGVLASMLMCVIASQAVLATDQTVPDNDRDGDGRADAIVLRQVPSSFRQQWWVRRSGGGHEVSEWGEALTQYSLIADVDGDGRVDQVAALRRSMTGYTFLIRYASGGEQTVVLPGAATLPEPRNNSDEPLLADFDGDTKADLALYYTIDGVRSLQVRSSIDGHVTTAAMARVGEVTPADFDGDLRADHGSVVVDDDGVMRWYNDRVFASPWGYRGDVVFPGDYDGDGRADEAVVRCDAGVWHWWIRGSLGAVYHVIWGYCPITDYFAHGGPFDYDGDGKVDLAVWRNPRPGEFGQFFIRSSIDGGMTVAEWGLPGDWPV